MWSLPRFSPCCLQRCVCMCVCSAVQVWQRERGNEWMHTCKHCVLIACMYSCKSSVYCRYGCVSVWLWMNACFVPINIIPLSNNEFYSILFYSENTLFRGHIIVISTLIFSSKVSIWTPQSFDLQKTQLSTSTLPCCSTPVHTEWKYYFRCLVFKETTCKDHSVGKKWMQGQALIHSPHTRWACLTRCVTWWCKCEGEVKGPIKNKAFRAILNLLVCLIVAFLHASSFDTMTIFKTNSSYNTLLTWGKIICPL